MTAAYYPYLSGTSRTPGNCNYLAPSSPGVGSAPLLNPSTTDNTKMESALAVNSLSVQMKAGGSDF